MIGLLLTIKIGLDPTLFEVGGLEVSWHGLLTAAGVVVGVGVAAWFARREGFPEDVIYNVALAMVIGGIIGARGLFVLEHLDEFRDHPGDIFDLNAGGISIYGALIGGAFGAWLYAIIQRLPNMPRAADVAALGAIVGMAIGRIGCLLEGDIFASTTDLPWGVVYTNSNSPSFGIAAPQHPAVAYELIGDLLIFGVLLLVYYRVQRVGVTFFAWVFLYGLLRVLVSFLRLDDIVFAGLRTAQIIAVVAMPFGLAGMVYLLMTPPQESRPTRSERRRRLREEATKEPRRG
jgi:phosphatidylglycerol:prolipoprotein diacylglycerol transferase